LETVAQMHPGRIHLLPNGESNLFNLLCASDMILLPAVHQPSGTLYAKSMAVGTPCIAHRMGAAADRVIPHPQEDSNGFLFDNLAPDTLLRTLRKALSVHSNTEEWGNLRARGAAQRFNWDVTAQRFLDLLHA